MDFMVFSDRLFREFNSMEFKFSYGEILYKVAEAQLQSHVGLKFSFRSTFSKSNSHFTASGELLSIFYDKYIEKYCHVRVGDQLDARYRLEVEKSDKIISKTQNLRDSLLAEHVKPKPNNEKTKRKK